MLNLSLAFAVLGLCLLLAGIVAFHVELRVGPRRGGLTFWTLRIRGRVRVGGSVYLPSVSARRARLPRQRRVKIVLSPAQRALFLNGME